MLPSTIPGILSYDKFSQKKLPPVSSLLQKSLKPFNVQTQPHFLQLWGKLQSCAAQANKIHLLIYSMSNSATPVSMNQVTRGLLSAEATIPRGAWLH